jgi:hypothetical protein
MQKLLALISMLSALTLPACERPDTALSPPPNLENRTRIDASIVSTMRLNLDLGEPSLRNTSSGPYQIEVRERETDALITTLTIPFNDTWPLEVEISAELVGRYTVSAFLDREADNEFDDCPFPRSQIDTERADFFDNVQGIISVSFPSESPQFLVMRRRICGPGPIDTGVSGRIEGLDPEERAEFKLKATELNSGLTLRTTVNEYTDLESGETRFQLTELLPGNYNLVFFLDNDNDNSPTPCSAQYGGADRAVVELNNVAILANSITELPEPVSIIRGDCPALLTGLASTITLGSSLNLMGLEGDRAEKLLHGGLWVRFTPTSGDRDMINIPVLETLIGRPEPFEFTVTGVEPGLWHITAYLDRDEDRIFSPCNTVNAGLDAVSGRAESIRIRNSEIVVSEPINLKLLDCGQMDLSAIRGRVTTLSESGPIGSGRPLILEIENQGSVQARQSITLFEAHNQLNQRGATFVKQLAPGRYSGRLFVDTTRDATYTSCDSDTYGDRYLGQNINFEVLSDSVTELGDFELTPDTECNSGLRSVTLEIVAPTNLSMPIEQLSLYVEEVGSWAESFNIDSWEEIMGVWHLPSQELPPGQYMFTLYSDDDANGEFSPCSTVGSDRYSATFSVVVPVDRAPPTARFPLIDGCPP